MSKTDKKDKKTDLGPAFEMSATNRKLINYRVYELSVKEKILYFTVAFVIGAMVAYLFYGGIGKDKYGEATLVTHICNAVICGLAGVGAGIAFLPIRRKQIIEKRRKNLRAQFIDLLDSLATSISAGKNVNNAFSAAHDDLIVQYHPDDYIIQEVDNIIAGINNNIDIGSMLLNFGERSGIQDIHTFGRVFETAYSKGANLKDVVRNSHLILSNKVQIETEIETKVASNKSEQYIMLIMPIILIAMIKLAGEDFASNFTTPSGLLSTTLAIGCFIGSFFLGRKILNIEV